MNTIQGKLDLIVSRIRDGSEARFSRTVAGLRSKLQDKQDDCLDRLSRRQSEGVAPDGHDRKA